MSRLCNDDPVVRLIDNFELGLIQTKIDPPVYHNRNTGKTNGLPDRQLNRIIVCPFRDALIALIPMPDLIATLALLLALELVLGVDNIVVISIIVSRLPEEARRKARIIGLALALVARLVMVAGATFLLSMTAPVILNFSVRDLILLVGGAFLLWKAVREIHHTVELIDHHQPESANPREAFASAIAVIVAVDIVFALDSVITAVGMTDDFIVIATAVILSFVVLLFAAEPIGEFVLKNPTFKILALSFLITIGIVLILEAFHHDIPKAYIYLPMGFASLIQLLQWRLFQNQKKKLAKKSAPGSESSASGGD